MLLDIFPVQGKSMNHKYIFILISNYGNKIGWKQSVRKMKYLYPAQKRIYIYFSFINIRHEIVL